MPPGSKACLPFLKPGPGIDAAQVRHSQRPTQELARTSPPTVVAEANVAERASATAMVADLQERAGWSADLRRAGHRRSPLSGGELGLPGHTQADRIALSGQRHPLQVAAGDLA